MNILFVLGVLCLTIGVSSATAICKGCVSIDEHSFEKVLPRFEVTLLKFDDSYPYGDKHNTFTEVAADIADNSNIILGQVGIKYYGEKDNSEFAKQFGIHSKEDLPSLRLFVQGEDEPFVYSKNMPWTQDDIKKFIRDHTNIYLGLPGCLETFDKLAMKLTTSSDKEAILKEAEQEAAKLKVEKEKNTAKIYIKLMKKVIEGGVSFVTQEEKRLTKLLDGKVNEKKKQELQQRLNILRSLEPKPAKTEL
ncbi:endoplasmic reticulum resident protein 29 [Anoplophora glabripennis]|uniref:endoplasmic reticulum resident protein 29 n=1 Tax=Anoplophora glabripennis TaxID=217634 RepID=UPI000873DD2C|nr:endoplasmic reticulum resident protein 29 [Anoplophora glabripennis]